ncbi:Kelch-like protein 13 [Orchesella cincta]|uniref:Kelch-like protein 13 n=1 Tax=Orchesella cincta TaxID=48709 RepID=A0A1D2M253_ORCCI|nr:Kelch-like protein 13 [Orchesella cincta]
MEADGTTSFIDSGGTSEYQSGCRLGFNFRDEIDLNAACDEGDKTFLTNLNDVIQSDQVRCSQRKTLFDIYLKLLPLSPVVNGTGASSRKYKTVGSVHGRFFKQLVEKLHLRRPLKVQLKITFDKPSQAVTIDTDYMTLISDPRNKLWPKAFKFEVDGDISTWNFASPGRSLKYTIEAEIEASPFIQSTGGLGIIPQEEDGETARLNKTFLEKRNHCDFTLLSGNGRNGVRCHKIFLAGSSPFFDRMINGDTKENECKLDGSTKDGLEALLKFIYYRSVEDALKSSVIAYELLDLGQKYEFPCLDEAMKGLLLAKLDDLWDLEVALQFFLRTRLMENNDESQPLKDKAKEVLKMKRAELMSDSNTLLNDLMAKNPEAAKGLIRCFQNWMSLDCTVLRLMFLCYCSI